jgi:type I restriction enzyme M protein
MQRGSYGLAEEFAADLRALHDHAERGTPGPRAPLRLSSSALVAVAELLEPYSLLRSPADVRGRAFQRMLDPALRAGLGQYFTPDAVVRFMVDAIAPEPGESVLDPFCGSGLFLRRAAEHAKGFGRRVGIEKSERMVRVAGAAAALENGAPLELLHGDALVDARNLPGIAPGSFDVVLTNPPFGALLGRDALARLDRFELAAQRRRVPLEILGLERSLGLLRPGGRIGIVLPEGLLGNRATRDVRDWLHERARIRAIIALPVAAFAPYGAALRTCLVLARRLRAGEPRSAEGSVFLARVDHVGHDATGRPEGPGDWPQLLLELQRFLAREGW